MEGARLQPGSVLRCAGSLHLSRRLAYTPCDNNLFGISPLVSLCEAVSSFFFFRNNASFSFVIIPHQLPEVGENRSGTKEAQQHSLARQHSSPQCTQPQKDVPAACGSDVG